MLSIWWAWLLAAVFTAILGSATFAFVEGYSRSKYVPGQDPGPGAFGICGFIAGVVFFFLYLCVTGAPISNLNGYYIPVSSFFYEGLGVPLLMPVVAAAVVGVLFVIYAIFSGIGVGLNLLGAKTRTMVDRTVEIRAAMISLRDEQARIKALEHQPDLGDLGDRAES